MGFAEAFPGVSLTDVVDWIGKAYLSPASADAKRRQEMKVRRDLYEDDGFQHFETMIRAMFSDPKVIDERLKVLPYSTVQNVTKRIVDAKATVYQQPAQRTVSRRQPAYKAFLDAVEIDQVMMQRNRYENLQNECFVKIGVFEKFGVVAPRLDIVTADQFSAIPHPRYPQEMLAIVLPVTPTGPGSDDASLVHWEVWTDTEVVFLDRNANLKGGEANIFGFIPGVLSHVARPVNSLLNGTRGDDIIDAHFRAVALDVLMLWGQKTGSKVPYTTGDMAATVRGQTLDANVATEFAEGVTPGVLDLGHDPGSLIDSSKFSTGQVAINHGMSIDLYFGTSAANSGHQFDLQRVGLKEKRREQIPQSRAFERELAMKAAVIMDTEADPMFRFAFEKWSIDFGEVETPMEPLASLNWRREAKSQGLRSVVDDVLEDNPDLTTRADAVRHVRQRQAEQAAFVLEQRALNMPQTPTVEDPGQSPEENGASTDASQESTENTAIN